MHVPSVFSARLELVSMSARCMRLLVERDLDAAAALLGASIPEDMPDRLDYFLRTRLAQLDDDPSIRPWLGRVMLLTDPSGVRHVVGSVGFHGPPDEDGRVEVGYSVEPAFRRQGIAGEAVRAMFDWASAERGIRRFRASIGPGNEPSLRLVARLGFRQTGVQIDEIDGEELVFELDGWPSGA